MHELELAKLVASLEAHDWVPTIACISAPLLAFSRRLVFSYMTGLGTCSSVRLNAKYLTEQSALAERGQDEAIQSGDLAAV